MTLSAEQYAQIAQGYEKASADPLVAAERRFDLAKEADWFRFLAQREGAHRPNNEHEHTAPSSLDFEPNSQGWSWRSTAPFLTTLWITGAAVYLVSTVLFTNAVNLFGTDEPKTPAPEIRQSVESVLKVPSVTNTAEQANEQPMATSERRHAITPDQPLYESAPLFEPSSPLLKAPLAAPVSSEPVPSTPSPAEELTTPVKTPSPTSRISQRPKSYADLPADEEFFSTRKRGLLSRRRILREGLLSPDFLPPE